MEKDIISLAESFYIKEDDGKKLSSDLTKALMGFEDWRLDVKDVVFKKYPEKKKEFIKAMSAVDKAIASVEDFVETI
tara:strand:+ start:323 stop:553 length:231 start_codon:yes stop_codon:yes gene_type:complete